MSKQMAPQTKYAVKLGVLTNSFYDPESKANLFRSTPYYFFNHKPTLAIKTAVKNGRLLDLNGNIENEEAEAVGVDTSKLDALTQENVRLATESAGLMSENATLKAENEALKAEIETLKSEVAKLADKPKATGKGKAKATETEAEAPVEE